MSQRGGAGEGHARRPGRSSSFGGHRGGGVGGAGKGGAGPSGGQPSVPSNRSFRKPGNGHGSHQRVVSQPDTTGFQSAPAPGPLQTPLRPPVPQNAPGHVPVPAPQLQHHDSSGVQAPLMSPVIENPAHIPLPKNIPRAAPRAPQKNAHTLAPQGVSKGESSKGFNLQFGSINMSGLAHFPARTSSAPPNLDEQKRNQALSEGHKVTPSAPVPPALKQMLPQQQQQQLQPPLQQQLQPSPQQQLQLPPQQQHQTRKDIIGSNHPNSVNTHVQPQVKRDVHVSPSVSSVAPPRPAVQPIPVMPMQMSHHPQQPQVPVHFSVHNQGVVPSSIQMSMGLPGVNAPQVHQQMYVPSIQQQHHQMHQQMMHQGQGMMFPPVGHQLPHQMGNMNLMAPQYPQQHQSKLVAPRKSVKITHPDTKQEVKLDKRLDSTVQRTLPNVTSQSQPVSGFAAQSMGFYPSPQQNSYNQSGMYYPSTTAVGQLPTGSQGTRFNYSAAQVGPPIPVISPSLLNTVPVSNKDSIVGPAGSGHSQITIKSQHGALHTDKSDHSVKISAPKLRVTEHAVPHRQKGGEVLSGIMVSSKSVSEESKVQCVAEKHSAVVSQPLPIQVSKPETDPVASSVANPASLLSGHDGKNKEAIQRTASLTDIKKNATRNDTSNLSQQPQSAASVEELKVQTFAKIGGDRVAYMEEKSSNKELDVTSSVSGLTAAPLENVVCRVVGASEAGITAASAANVSRDISPAKSSSKSSAELQGEVILGVAAVEYEKSEVTPIFSADLGEGKSSSDSTENELHEVGTTDLAEQVSVATCMPDSSDTMSPVTEQQELLKEPTPSVPEQHNVISNSPGDTETVSVCADDNVVSAVNSEPSSGCIIQSSIQETGLAVANITADVLSETHSLTSEGQDQHVGGVKDQISAASTTSVRPLSREKPTVEITRPKSTAGAGKKKKKKEMLSKADAAGTTDLYNAYKGPDEQSESIATAETDSSSIADTTHVLLEESEKEVNVYGDDGKKKVELDDWEDAADMSTPKLQSSDFVIKASIAQVSDSDTIEANDRKKYSRDFLLTFANQYYGLPIGIQMDTVTKALFKDLAGKSYVMDREPQPSPGRGTDRPTSRGDRRGAALDDDKWTRSGVPFSPGRDTHMDLANGPAILGHRGAPGGVSRNQRSGLLVGQMQSIAPQMSRSGSDADRWQQRGLIPSPATPMQVMHKAEKKYVVGKVSDEEQAKQRQLKAILNKLTPQNFEKLFEQVKEVNIDNVATLTGVISQIFDKALMEPTFCEMYANFCAHLAGALPDFGVDNEKITFKRMLLNKCQEEFERGEREEAEAEKTEEDGEIKQTKEEREQKRVKARRRMLGNIRLIGELYKKRMLTERIMHECIKKLLGDTTNPDEENIEALCKLMSTIGEMIDHPKAKEHMDAYFGMMHMLSTSQLISSRVRFLLRDSIDLRRNKWQQRRKVEGPKKIDEVHRDAAQERHAQSTRLSRGPVASSGPRRGAPPMDYSSRASAAQSPGSQQAGSRGIPPHSRGFGNQDIRFEEKHQFDNRTVPLPQRSEAITLGPQGGLARGMSLRGQPPVSIAVASSSNGYSSVASTAREVPSSRVPDHISGRTAPSTQSAGPSHRPASQEGRSGNKTYSLDDLRKKSIATIREYYSAKDEKEVALCIEELNAPSFHSSVVSLWVNDSFERKDMERELLAKLFVGLCNGGYELLSKPQLIEGLASVLASLEDALSDSPRASEYFGRLVARFVLENILSLQEVGRLIEEGGEEPGYLVRGGMAADVLGAVLESMKAEKGDAFFQEAKTSSNLKLESFRPQHLKRSKLDPFM